MSSRTFSPQPIFRRDAGAVNWFPVVWSMTGLCRLGRRVRPHRHLHGVDELGVEPECEAAAVMSIPAPLAEVVAELAEAGDENGIVTSMRSRAPIRSRALSCAAYDCT